MFFFSLACLAGIGYAIMKAIEELILAFGK
jgi:hypothetical protein